MHTLIKIAGLSAILSAGLVTAYEARSAMGPGELTKVFYDRVDENLPANVAARATPVRVADMGASVGAPDVNRSAKGDRSGASTPDCAGQAWPYRPADCAEAAGAPARKAVRVISLENRDKPAVSVVAKAGETRR